MKLNYLVVSLVMVLVFSSSMNAQKVWERDWKFWSVDEALLILKDSPFAKSYMSPEAAAAAEQANVTRELNQSVLRGGSNPRSSERSAGIAPIVARLHSSLQVRQAIVRLRQLSSDYGKLSGGERRQFDDQQRAYIENPLYNDYYVISVTKFADSTQGKVDEGIFERTTLQEIKGNVFLLSDSGERLDVFQFTPAKGGSGSAYFFFKRLNNKGEPFLKPSMKTFRIVFSNDFLTSSNPYTPYLPRNFEFNIGKITFDNHIEF
ncbi:MAG: hypothetical protein ACKN97_02740 [Acidobacteriota bacterium]